jgi:hypothetical protein
MDGDIDAAIEYMLAEQLILGSDDADGDPYLDYACDGKHLIILKSKVAVPMNESHPYLS